MRSQHVAGIADRLLETLASLQRHVYGEHVDMLAHSLQTAVCARADGAGDHMVLAALCHDVGHSLGDATRWGLPGHAAAGARFLEPWFALDVVEPIRLHVAAKRFLVASDPTYMTNLSHASRQSLGQQGGPFEPAKAVAFSGRPFADDAISLRRWDDAGKTAGLNVDGLDYYRPLIVATLNSRA